MSDKPRNTLALTIEFDGKSGKDKIEIHTLNPGTREHIERFGGSRHSLFADKTASIVTRSFGGNMLRDVELDIYDPNFWAWIAKLINGDIEAKVTAAPAAPPAS